MISNFSTKAITTVIQDFSGVYAEQPFMQKLRESAATDSNIHWLDCTQIDGTDCYCDDEAQAVLNKMIDKAVAATPAASNPGIHFFDNGNYHYMSKLWTDRITEPFDLVAFDHHPDMQPPRFEGILSCGSWIKEVLEQNKFVQNVIIIGVADHLVEEVKNDILPFQKKVQFISESELASYTPEKLSSLVCSEFTSVLSSNLYISIDKDALSASEAATNWDQGSLTFEQIADTLTALAQNHKILGVDICGERARNMGFEDTAAADALNNTLNEKLYNLIYGLQQPQ